MNALKRLVGDAERNYYTLYKYDYIRTYFITLFISMITYIFFMYMMQLSVINYDILNTKFKIHNSKKLS